MTRSKKVEPSVQTLMFSTAVIPEGTTESVTIDISQCASLVNRRFYRQGLNWVVAGIKVIAPNPASVLVRKLPNTWVMSNAWEKGFRAWMKMNKEALEEAPSIKPKFLDFKVYADATHHAAGYAANLIPFYDIGFPAPVYTTAEWESSKIHVPDTTGGATGDTRERELIAVGASYPGAGGSGFNAVSLIEGYAASRGLPEVLDPNVPGDAADADGTQPQNWMTALFNEGTQQSDEVISDMIAENNIAPYPFENDGVHVDTMYPGGANQAPVLEIHDYDTISATTIGGMTRIKGGNFPCGLMRFDLTPSDVSQNFIIQVNLVPGTHRGYLCEPMTEM